MENWIFQIFNVNPVSGKQFLPISGTLRASGKYGKYSSLCYISTQSWIDISQMTMSDVGSVHYWKRKPLKPHEKAIKSKKTIKVCH